ncbi:hypothetical protein F5Y18DRAFT_379211 [Xylariaceae sp. FL1019]|nr:hypothetical protein F5Y18DRAFT_379211 [Xylariaceae sp. FL1019]
MAPTSTTQREAMSSVAPTSTAGHTDLSNSQYRTPQESKYDNLKDGMHRGVPTGTSRTQANVGRGSTDSSHGGQYDVLSSGTPSGVHINDHPTSHISSNAKSFEQERKQSTYLSNTSPIKTSSSKAVAPRGPYSHEYEQKDDYNNGRAISNMEQAAQGAAQKKVQEEPTSATRQMVAEDGYGSASKPIIHNCVNCGHGNDISRYFKS